MRVAGRGGRPVLGLPSIWGGGGGGARADSTHPCTQLPAQPIWSLTAEAAEGAETPYSMAYSNSGASVAANKIIPAAIHSRAATRAPPPRA